MDLIYLHGAIKLNPTEDISPFCWATDTLVLDFLWHLLWVSKPEKIPLLAYFVTFIQQIPQIHLWCNTCWPIGSQYGNWVISSTYLSRSIGEALVWNQAC